MSLKPGRKVDGPKPKGRVARPVGQPSGPIGELGFSWISAPGKLLVVLIQWNEKMEQRRVAALAGVNYKSSTFRNALTKLRQVDGLIGSEGKKLWVTEAGRAQYADFAEELPSGDKLLEGWRGICAEAGTDPNSSTARNAYTKLRNLGLIETGGSKRDLQLTEHVLEAMA
jgi:hypothetical protein